MPASKPLSKLELLPDELLLQIFDESSNASLAFSSPRLHELVGFDRVKQRLIIACCKDRGITDRIPNFSHENLRMLMLEKWLTLGWIHESLWSQFAEFAWEEVRKWMDELKIKTSITVTAEQALVDEVQQLLLKPWPHFLSHITEMHNHQELPILHISLNSTTEAQGYIVDVLDPQHKLFEGFVPYGRDSFLLYANHCGGGSVRINTSSYIAPTSIGDFIRNFAIFPNKLLTGPWTRTQGDVLAFFMGRMSDCYTTMRNSPKDKRVCIKKGILNAIISGCIPAIAVLGDITVDGLRKELGREASKKAREENSSASKGRELDNELWETCSVMPLNGPITRMTWTPEQVNSLLDKARTAAEPDLWLGILYCLSKRLSKQRRGQHARLRRRIERYLNTHDTAGIGSNHAIVACSLCYSAE